MRSYCVTDFAAPLTLMEKPTPQPTGSEVLLAVERCGVCHSDIHIWDGYYDAGGGKRLELKDRGITPPVTMGHEIVGRVVALGPAAQGAGVKVGDTRLVFPWIGCGTCIACKADEDHLCMAPRSLGVFRPGGYADHVMVPDAKYLVEIGSVDPSVAAPYACSGLTAYSALAKVMPFKSYDWLVLIGAGGLGLACIALLQALGMKKVIVVDIDPVKREAALKAGAPHALDGRAADLSAQIAAITGGNAAGGVAAVIDFVGSSATAAQGIALPRKGGRYVIVGLFGGDVTLSLPTVPTRALSIIGSYTGSLPELRELMDLVRSGKVPAIPIKTVPLDQATAVLEDLKAGKIIGRVVLQPA